MTTLLLTPILKPNRIQIEFIRRMPMWKKLSIVDGLNETVKTLAITGIKQRFPNATPAQVKRMLAELCWAQTWRARYTIMPGELHTRDPARHTYSRTTRNSVCGGRLPCQFPARRDAFHVGCGYCCGYAYRTYPAVGRGLSKEFYADDEMMKDAIEHHSSFNLIHYETAFKVDIFICKTRPL